MNRSEAGHAKTVDCRPVALTYIPRTEKVEIIKFDEEHHKQRNKIGRDWG